ncbi:HBR151Cp [Eremothecium sinecaudum]|uniref:GrpE protein homolog n=1 Tax=Eremothecium sinecaudum TaxID=45286 RepID=A0A120K164_9SACH|nr:HBR151Cp [Eremothecium sinecaudum]AMD19052.1 HBR151Cp [Eremothecium sinecaudum]
MRLALSPAMKSIIRQPILKPNMFATAGPVTSGRLLHNLQGKSSGTFQSRFYSQESEKEQPKEESSKTEDLTEEQQKLKTLEEQLEAKSKDAAELKDRLLRSVADFRNLQEVTKKDIQKAKDFALQKFARDLLESVDNFGHALQAFKPESLEKSQEIKDLYTGVKMTKDVFEKTLKKHGIEKIEPLGEQFDPNKHEATFELPQLDKEPGTIFHVQQAGFSLNNRVIRPAKVGVVKDVEK